MVTVAWGAFDQGTTHQHQQHFHSLVAALEWIDREHPNAKPSSWSRTEDGRVFLAMISSDEFFTVTVPLYWG